MEEIWKDIPNYEGLYQASSFGRIKSLGRIKKNGFRKESFCSELILKPSLSKHGYYKVSLCKSNIRYFRVNRLIALTFISNPYCKIQVNHIDGNKLNNNILNLEWATRSENQIHAVNTGLRNKSLGENSHFSKLTKNEVLEIRAIGKNLKRKEICDIYNISYSLVGKIISNTIWKNI